VAEKKVTVQFNGPVGQAFVGGTFGRVDTAITMDDDGNMVMFASVELDEQDEQE
jgi:hypothetical protein